LVGYIDLRSHHDHGFFIQLSAEAGQLDQNHFHIFHDVGTSARIRRIGQVNQQPRAFDMPQELRA